MTIFLSQDSPPAKQLASSVNVVVKPPKPPVPLKDRLGKKGEGGDDRDASRSRSRGRSRSRSRSRSSSRSRRRDSRSRSRSRWSTFTRNYYHVTPILVRSRSRRRSRSGSRRRRSRSRFQTHLVFHLLSPVHIVLNLLLKIRIRLQSHFVLDLLRSLLNLLLPQVWL